MTVIQEAFEPLWENSRHPEKGRWHAVSKAAFDDFELPERVRFGGIMRFPADTIIREDSPPVSIVANTINLGWTDDGDPNEERELLVHLRRFAEAYTDPVTVFLYTPPLPTPIMGERRGWSMRHATVAGHGWRLVEGVLVT
jgi:hypothetical protein